METVQISFDVETSDSECPLGIQVWLNDSLLLDNPHVQEKIAFAHDMSDDDGENQLRIVISGKTADHTQIDDQGNILKDMCIKLINITVDGLSCSPEYVYHHINLHTDLGQVVQSNYWGFNGYVELNFDYANSFFWALDCSC